MGIDLSDTRLHGSRSRDLERQDRIDADTLFAVHRGANTKHSTYDDLSSTAAVSALALMKVGTMAFEEKWEYSLSSHDHGNYTSVSAWTLYKTGTATTPIVGTLSVGDVCVEGLKRGQCTVMSVYVPAIDNPIPEEPAYGTLRFMYSTKSRPAADSNYISSADFDGWVYPDGSQPAIVPSQFTKAGNRFVTRDSNPFVDGGKLKLPDLRGQFFKLNPFTEREAAGGSSRCVFAARASHNAVPSHTHPISKLSATVTLTADMNRSSFKICSGASGTPIEKYAHNGKNDPISGSPFKYTAKVNFDAVQLEL